MSSLSLEATEKFLPPRNKVMGLLIDGIAEAE